MLHQQEVEMYQYLPLTREMFWKNYYLALIGRAQHRQAQDSPSWYEKLTLSCESLRGSKTLASRQPLARYRPNTFTNSGYTISPLLPLKYHEFITKSTYSAIGSNVDRERVLTLRLQITQIPFLPGRPMFHETFNYHWVISGYWIPPEEWISISNGLVDETVAVTQTVASSMGVSRAVGWLRTHKNCTAEGASMVFTRAHQKSAQFSLNSFLIASTVQCTGCPWDCDMGTVDNHSQLLTWHWRSVVVTQW